MARKQDTTQLDLFLNIPQMPPGEEIPKACRVISEETRQKMRERRLGRQWSEEAKQKMSESAQGIHTGAKNGNWKGGETELLCKTCGKSFFVGRQRLGYAKYCSILCRKNDPDKKSALHKRIRASIEYKAWRLAVFTRDDFTCQMCGRRGGTLQADHVKPFALFPELRFSVENGRTLCIDCHSKTDTFGVHTWRRKKFLLERQEPLVPRQENDQA